MLPSKLCVTMPRSGQVWFRRRPPPPHRTSDHRPRRTGTSTHHRADGHGLNDRKPALHLLVDGRSIQELRVQDHGYELSQNEQSALRRLEDLDFLFDAVDRESRA